MHAFFMHTSYILQAENMVKIKLKKIPLLIFYELRD